MELPQVGTTCGHPNCTQLDFLAFRCHKCNTTFCEPHYRAADHACLRQNFDDARSYKCPLCQQQLAVVRGEDPNMTVERHLASNCQTGVARSAPQSKGCAVPKCRKKEFIAVTCPDCKRKFCTQHRFPEDHACVGQRGRTAQAASARQHGASSAATRNNAQLTEDELMAMAIQASLEDQQRQNPTASRSTSSSNSNCIIA